MNLKDIKALALQPLLNEKDVELASAPGARVHITRVSVAKRNQILAAHKNADKDAGVASQMTLAFIVASLDDCTIDDLMELPSAVVDEIGRAVLDFNGWSKEGRAVAEAQF